MSQPSASRHVVSSSPLLSSHLLRFLLDRLSLSFSGLLSLFLFGLVGVLVGGAGFDSFDSNPFLPGWSVSG